MGQLNAKSLRYNGRVPADNPFIGVEDERNQPRPE